MTGPNPLKIVILESLQGLTKKIFIPQTSLM